MITLPSFTNCPYCGESYQNTSPIETTGLKCNKCSSVFWIRPQMSVSVLATFQNDILIIQRNGNWKHGWWCLPGGFVDYAEAPKEAAVREFGEETGLSVSKDELHIIDAYHDIFDASGTGVDIIYHMQLTSTTLPKENDTEVKKKLFVKRDDLPRKINPVHKKAITDYFSNSSISRWVGK